MKFGCNIVVRMSKINPAGLIMSQFLRLRERSGLTTQEVAERCGKSVRTVYRWERGECKPELLAVRMLQDIIYAANAGNRVNGAAFRYIDLFAGIGGFRRAFDSIGGECVFTSEWDKACRTTYIANYGADHPVEGDIREFTKDEESLARIPAHDVLVAGFPCQPFSIAGVSKKNALGRAHGFRCETQGTLFFDLAQIIEYHQPPVFLLENVKNLMSHDGGKTFDVIRRTLEEELGYTIKVRVLDAQHWVPQHRERILIAGFRNDVGFDFKRLHLPDPAEKPVLASIFHKTDGSEPDEPPYLVDGEVGAKYTLTANLWDYLQRYKEKHQAAGNGFGFGLFGPNDVARTLSARYYKDGSEILIRQEGERPRRLTPRECARLMGFDRQGEANFQIPVSDTQAYKQFGNSVVVPKVTAVAQLMFPYIMRAIQAQTPQLEIPFAEEALMA